MNSYSKARSIAEAIQSAGGRAVFVGGYVRDTLIGNVKPKDIDLEVYNLDSDKLKEVLSSIPGKLNIVGESFKVFKLSWWDADERLEIDISIPREDIKVGEGHKGFEVVGNPNASFEEAAIRRDFTMNAIMQDPLTDEIIDPYSGHNDINNKIINVVDEKHFAEDSLRVLRAAQFSSRFNFKISEKTKEISRAISLKDLPKERIWIELEKMFLKSYDVKVGFYALYELNIIEQLFPELIFSADSIPYSAMNYINNKCDYIDVEEKIICHLALIAYAIPEQLRETFIESTGAIALGKKVVEESIKLARHNLIPLVYRRDGVSDTTLRKLPFNVNPILLTYLTEAQGQSDAANWFRKKMGALKVYYGPQVPFLHGKDLIEEGMEPGPEFGKYLDEAYELQMQGKIKSIEEAKGWLRYAKKR